MFGNSTVRFTQQSGGRLVYILQCRPISENQQSVESEWLFCESKYYELEHGLRINLVQTTNWTEQTSTHAKRYYILTPGGVELLTAYICRFSSLDLCLEYFYR